MVLLGALVNGAAAVVGGGLGLLLGSRIKEELSDFLMVAMGLCVAFVAVQGMAEGGNALVVTLCVTLGAVIGHLLDIDGLIRKLGDGVQAAADKAFAGKQGFSNLSRGFVSASLVVCVGSMAIVGSLESGLSGNHATLFTKSLMDLVICIPMAASLGAGVMLSGVALLVYEGLLSLAASFVAPLLTAAVIQNMLAVGSVLLFGLALTMANIANIKVANLIPACFLPVVVMPLMQLAGLM